jgi:hypothetical protein
VSGGTPPTLNPQVIGRGEGKYALTNIDLDGLTDLQRLGVAMLIWDQVRMLMEANGTYKERDPHVIGVTGIGTTDDIDNVVAELLEISPTGVNRVRPRLYGNTEMIEKLLAGEYTSHKKLRVDLGMILKPTFAEGGESRAKHKSSYFGHGDKFHEAIGPLLSYFRAWRKKDYRFPHVNPKEAQRRVKAIDQVMADLAKTREDLVQRSHVATYRAPSEKRRENK